ncbi:MAG: YkgJ family cysteine cluster protein, partial [Bacteroidales bacterium]|nr:YkgJ family cysteine cluster protein [Bacteroidales bacterium]
EIEKIFYDDGYRLASDFLHEGIETLKLKQAIHRIYESVDGLLDAFLQRTASENNPTECMKGCDWCCYQAVFAVTHELLYLREFIKTELPGAIRVQFEESARRKADITLQIPVNELQKIKEPCPFLRERSCQVYEARPMACRIYLSSSEQSCKEEFEDPRDETNIPQLYEFPLRAGRMLNEGFVAYLRQKGLHVAELPLEQGYMSLVTLDQDFDSWIQP